MWSWVEPQAIPALGEPPINEVICGVLFDSLPIDPVVAGAFWVSRRSEYPKRMFLPALAEGRINVQPDAKVTISGPGGHVRTWLVSKDNTRLLQFQHDRFYLNWRAQAEGRYPRFSGPEGLKCLTEAKFAEFADFCEEVVERRPEPRRVELGKIDMLNQGSSWDTFEDLRGMLPTVAPFLRLAEGEQPNFTMSFGESIDGCELQVGLSTTLSFHAGSEKPVLGVRIETTVRSPVEGSIGDAFAHSNDIANSAFLQLVPDAAKHFGGR